MNDLQELTTATRTERRPMLSKPFREDLRHKQAIQRAVRQLIRSYKKTHAHDERRKQGRTDFVQPVTVRLDGEREYTVLSRDISETGIRLIADRSFLGQRVKVTVPGDSNVEPACFLVRILWTCAVGDGLFENGGAFLEMVS